MTQIQRKVTLYFRCSPFVFDCTEAVGCKLISKAAAGSADVDYLSPAFTCCIVEYEKEIRPCRQASRARKGPSMAENDPEAAKLDDLPPARSTCVNVAGKDVAFFNVDGIIYAMEDCCLHHGTWLGNPFLKAKWSLAVATESQRTR